MTPRTRVVFYHCGAHQYIADVPTTNLLASLTLAIDDIAYNQKKEDVLTLENWLEMSSNNSVAFLSINFPINKG